MRHNSPSITVMTQWQVPLYTAKWLKRLHCDNSPDTHCGGEFMCQTEGVLFKSPGLSKTSSQRLANEAVHAETA